MNADQRDGGEVGPRHHYGSFSWSFCRRFKRKLDDEASGVAGDSEAGDGEANDDEASTDGEETDDEPNSPRSRPTFRADEVGAGAAGGGVEGRVAAGAGACSSVA